jgi:uncharacterized SAM-binding protein YcdF (DUF218 family)
MTGFGFYELSKIVWALIAPQTLLLLPFAIALWALWRGRRRMALYALTVGLILMLAIGILPLGDLLLAPLESRYPASPRLGTVDAIIILGGATNEDVTRRWGVPAINEAGDRYLAGAALAHRFPDAHIFFSGGSGRLLGGGLSEAVAARAILANAGVDPARIRFEGRSRSTAENAGFLRRMIGAPSQGQWVLVTSAYHMPRAMLTFCAAGWRGLVAYPADYQSTGFGDGIGWDLAGHLQQLDIAAKEWVGLAAYRLTGRAARSC